MLYALVQAASQVDHDPSQSTGGTVGDGVGLLVGMVVGMHVDMHA